MQGEQIGVKEFIVELEENEVEVLRDPLASGKDFVQPLTHRFGLYPPHSPLYISLLSTIKCYFIYHNDFEEYIWIFLQPYFQKYTQLFIIAKY